MFKTFYENPEGRMFRAFLKGNARCTCALEVDPDLFFGDSFADGLTPILTHHLFPIFSRTDLRLQVPECRYYPDADPVTEVVFGNYPRIICSL
jgi:hypothetical protein